MVLSWALQNEIPQKKSSRIVTNDLIIKFNFRTKASVLHKVDVSIRVETIEKTGRRDSGKNGFF